MTTYPVGYGDEMVSLDELVRRHGPSMHPAYARRLWLWIEATGIGIGGGWRPTPSNTSAASQAGKSFHQSQRFASGYIGFCAVDLVVAVPGAIHRAPTWDEVPAQGGSWAAECGLHANVSGEPWHLQPVEIDGYDSWTRAGRPDPDSNYPPNPTPPPQEDDDMQIIYRHTKYADQFLVGAGPPIHISVAMRKAFEAGGVEHVTDSDGDALDDLLKLAGLTRADLTPV